MFGFHACKTTLENFDFPLSDLSIVKEYGEQTGLKICMCRCGIISKILINEKNKVQNWVYKEKQGGMCVYTHTHIKYTHKEYFQRVQETGNSGILWLELMYQGSGRGKLICICSWKMFELRIKMNDTWIVQLVMHLPLA